jgi:hypothetical protein
MELGNVYMAVNKILETLRNCVGYNERTDHLFTLCSALVILLSERIGKWETCPILQEGGSLVCL